MLEPPISARHSRSLQKRASDSPRNHWAHAGGYGVSMVGRHDPTCWIFRSVGTASETIAKTERKVNWNEGSKRSSGRQTSKPTAAAPITFSEFARRQTIGAKPARVNIEAARTTGS